MKATNNKKRISLLLAAAMLISIFAGIFATTSKPTFPDVPADHWAYASVNRASENGWIAGYSNGRFGPADNVTYGQFALMLGRSVDPYLISAYGGDPSMVEWYVPCMAVMRGDSSYCEGTPIIDSDIHEIANEPVNRYNMAQILFNIMTIYDKVPSYDAAAVQAGIADWKIIPDNYKDALMAVVSAGIISGVDDKGTFNGSALMNRGQAAAVLCRMYDVFSGAGTTTPATPDGTDTSTSTELGQKLPSGATAAAGVKSSIGKDDAYPTYGPSDVVSNNGYYSGATDVDIGDAELVYELLDMVNAARAEEGSPALKWTTSDQAEEYTLLRAHELASNFSHDRPNGSYNILGEVCTNGPTSSVAAYNNWMNSAAHKEILMDPGNEYMIAARSGNRWIICLGIDGMDLTLNGYAVNNYTRYTIQN